jgi:hypothetical protein
VGTLQDKSRCFSLLPTTIIGRSRECNLVLAEDSVSKVHAELTWGRQGWFVQDLSSRNGTWLDGTRLEPRDERLIRPGALLRFADSVWTAVDVSRPLAAAISGDDEVVEEAGTLLLRGHASELLSLVERGGSWYRPSGEGRLVRVADDVVRVGGRDWELSLPCQEADTEEGERPWCSKVLWTLDDATLVVEHGPRVLWRSESSYVRLLHLLARRWLRGSPGSRSRGWVSRVGAASALGVCLGTVDVLIHRARSDARASGILRGGDVVQSRRRSGQVRFGGRRIAVRDQS